MKHLLLLLTFSFALPAVAEFKTPDEAVQNLKSYKADDFVGLGDPEKPNKEVDFYDDLDAAVKFTETHAPDEAFMKALVQATSLALKNDPSWYAGEVVAPAWKKHKKAFEKALNSLSKKDAADVKESILNAERELRSGNG